MNTVSGGKKPWVTKLSSAGLVYFHFGHRVISVITGMCDGGGGGGGGERERDSCVWLSLRVRSMILLPTTTDPSWMSSLPAACIYNCLSRLFLHVGIDPSEEDLLEELFDRVYANFVEEVDAVDNGISAFDGTPRYRNRPRVKQLKVFSPVDMHSGIVVLYSFIAGLL